MDINQETNSTKRFPLAGFLVPAFVLSILITFNVMRTNEVTEQPTLADLGYFPQLEPSQVDHFNLVDQHNMGVDESLFTGKWSLVFFGFTHCPDFCPTTLSILAQLESIMQGDTPQIILVSVDPERDTPMKLGEYASAFSSNVVALTGTIEDIQALATSLHVVFERRPDEVSETYQVDHSVNIALINPGGHFIGSFTVPHRVAEMQAALARVTSP